jgi:hypothetical protein
MESRSISLRGQVEHRRVRKLLNFLPYATENLVDVEGAFRPIVR